MNSAATLSTAIAAIALGAALLGLAVLSLRWYRDRGARTMRRLASPVSLPPDRASADTAVLVTQAGGRVLFANDRARQFFELNGQTPNFWQMVQQARPAETFLELCVTEGKANLSIGERRVEATSLRLPLADGRPEQFVVVLRETGLLPELPGVDERLVQAMMTLLADISRAISSSLDLPETCDAILTHVSRAFPYNLAEITLWDAAHALLRPIRHAGDPDYARELARVGAYYKLDEGYSGWIATHRQPLLIADVESFTLARPKLLGPDFPFRSYMGVPLIVDEQFLGTLELASYKAGAYKHSDALLFHTIAGQAAIAIRNAQRFAEQQRHVAELSGLAEITRAIEATSDPRELYTRLTADIARFMGVQLVGFLLHDTQAHALVAQAPFYGVPDIVVEIYRIPLRPGSAAERLWLEAQSWLSNDVAHDRLVAELGLQQLAGTVGVKATLLAPITIGGRRLGALQVSNKINGVPFGDEDTRLLVILAGQAAAILDNARLVREAEARAERAEGLRQIAATTASGADLETILRAAMQQTADLLHFELGMIVLWDEARGELVPHPASVYGVPPAEALPVRLSTDDPFFPFSVTRTRRPFLSGRAAHDRRIIGFYRTLVDRFQVSSAMDAPLVVSERSIGEMIVVAHRERAFTRADLQLLSTVASQLASAIERARLHAATDQNLQRRVDQLTALTRVSRELNQTLALERILRLVHDEAVHATRATCGTIVLFDLEAGAGQVALRLGDEALGHTLTALEAQVAGGDARLRRVRGLTPDSPLPAHPDVRAALVVPIMVQGQVVGLIHLHSDQPVGFDEAAEDAALALAAQTAIAVENARRFEDEIRRGDLLRRRADQLAQLFEISRSVRSDRPLAANLEAIAFGLQEAVGFNLVLISVLDAKTRRLKRTAAAGIPLAAVEQLSQVEQPWEEVAHLLHEEYRLSQSYFFPVEKTADLTTTLGSLGVAAAVPGASASEAAGQGVPHAGRWHVQDRLIVPLRGSGAEPVGLLSLEDPRDGQRPSRSTIEIIEIFANQAAQAIENARLYDAAERRAARLLALHRVVEAASSVTDRGRLWQTVAEALLAEMSGPDVCLIALAAADGGGLTIQGKAGRLHPHVEFGPLVAVDNPLAQALSEHGPVLVLSTTDSPWALNPLILATEVTSFVSVPILSEGRPAGALFLGAQRTPTPFSPDDVEVFTILANQLGASLESARLEADIHGRAAQLAALAEVSQAMTSTLRTEDVVAAVLGPRGLQRVVPYDSFTLWLREGDQLRIAAAQGFEIDAERLGLRVDIADSTLFAEMAETRTPILVPEVRQDARFAGGEFQPTQSWLAAPLVSKGHIIGVLALDKVEARYYTAQAAQVLMAFANQAAVALDNARLYEESQERARELDERSQRLALLNRASAQLGGTLQMDQVYAMTLNEIRGALSVERALMVALDERGQARLVAQSPPSVPATDALEYNPALYRVRDTQAPLAIEDVAHDTLLATTAGAARSPGAALVMRGVKSLLVVPLMATGRLVAMIQLEEHGAIRHFTPGEIELAQTLANQAAVAIQNAHLYDETQARLSELATLNQLSRAISSTIDVQQIYQIVAEQVTEVMDVDNLSLALYDETNHLLSFPMLLERGVPLSREPRPLLLQGDNLEDKLRQLRALQAGVTGAKSYLGVPLLIGDRVMGILAVQDTERAHAFDAGDERMLTTIAAQLTVALENARLYQQVKAQQRNATALAHSTQVMSRTLRETEVLQALAQELFTTYLPDGVTLWHWVPAASTLTATVVLRDPSAPPPAGRPWPSAGQSFSAAERPDLMEVIHGRKGGIRPIAADNPLCESMSLPLLYGGDVEGAAEIIHTGVQEGLDQDDLDLFQAILVSSASALQSARLFEQTQAALAERTRTEQELRRRHEELVALNRVTAAVTSVLDLHAVLRAAAREMVLIFNARNTGIALLNPERTHLTVIADYSARPDDPSAVGLVIPVVGNPSSSQVVETGNSLVLPQAHSHPMTAAIHEALRARRTECLMIVPLRARGEVIGTIGVDTDQADREFTPTEVTLAETIAGQIVGAVENARFAQELEARVAARTQDLERERRRVETLLQITSELSSSLDLDRVLARALELVTEEVHAPQGSIFLIDLETDRLIYRATRGRPQPLPPGGQPAPFKRHEPLVGWVIKNRQAVVIGDLERDPRWVQLPEHQNRHKSALAVPLVATEDVLGAMMLLSPQYDAFDEAQLRLVEAAASQVGAAINNAELYRLIRDQAERLGGMLRGQQVEATKSRAILEGIADGVLVADGEGEVILFNAACERVLKLDRQTVIGRPVTEFVGIYGAAGKAWVETVTRWGKDPASYHPGEFVAQQISLEDDQVISVHLAPVIAGEEYLGSVSVIRDITHEVEIARLKSEFVSNVSHELRTPMTSIKGYADILLMGAGGPLTPDQARFIEVIKNNADRLSVLVNDLLDISRIESGRAELVLRPIPIEDVIRDVVVTMQGRIDEEAKPMTLRAQAPEGLPPVWGDRERVTQILMNLADNAFSYSQPGGVITLRAAPDLERGEMLVEVADDGIGIPPEDQPRLFDRFYRGEDALVLAKSGTGLGLPIARQLAELHGGRLWLVRSDVGKGTTFGLALPLAPVGENQT